MVLDGVMRFIILGAGSLGCVFGGMLAEADNHVTLVARGENYDAIRRRGLTVRTIEGSIYPKVEVASDPSDVQQVDVAFVMVKARDTEQILKDSKHLIDHTIFVSFQNSGDKDDVLVKYVGVANIIGGVTINGATLAQPGIAEWTAVGRTWLGKLPRGSSERIRELTQVLNEAKIPTEVVDNVSTIKWAKLVQFCAFAGVSALTRLRLHQILRDPKLTVLFIRLVRDGAKVMRATGIELDNYEGLIPLKKVVEEPDYILVREYAKRANEMAKRPLGVTISMLQDVLRGRPLEVEETLGYIIRKAQELSVEVPTLQTVYELVLGLQSSYLPIDSSNS